MKLKTFLLLAGLTIAAVIGAILAVHSRDAAAPADAAIAQPLIPGLTQRLNQVTVMVLTTASATVTLARSDPESSRWTIVEKAGYPADGDQVRRLIVALAGARTLEPRTADPAHYAKLALDDAAATIVTLRCADGTDLPGLALGKTLAASSPDHTGSFYARRTTESRAWLAEGRLPALSAEQLQWLTRDLPSLPSSRIAAVTVGRAGGETIAISRKDPATADFAVTGLPRTAKPKQAKINDLATAAEFLSLEDVAPAEANPPQPTVTTSLRSFEGETLTIRIWRRDNRAWAGLTAGLEGEGRSPEAEQRVKDLQAHYAGWVYRLSDAAAKALAPTADELIEAPVPPEGSAKRDDKTKR